MLTQTKVLLEALAGLFSVELEKVFRRTQSDKGEQKQLHADRGRTDLKMRKRRKRGDKRPLT